TTYFLAILSISILSLSSCNEDNATKVNTIKEGFVYLDGKDFKIGDEKFFPIMMNYMVDVRFINDEYLLGPNIAYDSIHVYEGKTKSEVHKRLRAHLKLIKEFGFNSIRLVGFNTESYNDT